MIDQLIRGGRIVDGTGRDAFIGDVGIAKGRIVALGKVDEPARRVLDADGLVVTPGFVDPHTHLDAQLFWDPAATPSGLHGVTSVVGGNCGFSLAPVRSRDADYLRQMMARVEAIPLAALEDGVPWTFESFAEYLDALEGRIAVNAGVMVGHCAIRRYVMGADAVGGVASTAQIAEMVDVLHGTLAAGGLGFSTTLCSAHVDGDGEPVPSRSTSLGELFALCRAVADHEGTSLEGSFEGGFDSFSDDEVRIMVEMTLSTQRTLNWNLLELAASGAEERVRRQLRASRAAEAAGGRIIALTMPALPGTTMSFLTPCGLQYLPGWGELYDLAVNERVERLRDPALRQVMLAGSTSKDAGIMSRIADFDRYVIGDTYSAANTGLSGRTVGEIAAERGTTPLDALLDIVIADDCRTVLWRFPEESDELWALRQRVWDDPAVLLGASDAGAHVDRICGAPYPTRFLAETLRGHQIVTLERAVHMMTQAPAQLFGLVGRGTLALGGAADVVVFDPETVDAERPVLVDDLPRAARRLTAASRGVVRVLVNGVETVADGAPTGERPGRVLRSGRDTAGTALCDVPVSGELAGAFR